MATHSSVLAWRIPGTEKPGGLPSMGSHRVGHDWSDLVAAAAAAAVTQEKAMAPHSSTFAWKIPWIEEPGGLQSMGSRRVGHDWATSLSRVGEGNGNPLQCSCLENPRDGGAWWAAVYGVAQSRTRLKRLSSSSSSIHFWVNPWQRACGHHSQFTQIIWSAADTRELATVSTRATPKAQANELFCKASLILFLSSFFS